MLRGGIGASEDTDCCGLYRSVADCPKGSSRRKISIGLEPEPAATPVAAQVRGAA